MPKVIKSVSLDSDVVEAIQQEATQDDRPFSRVVNRVLREHLERQKSE